MSTEAFSPAVFPRLHGDGLTAEREKARVRGYAEGHAEGFRAGSAAAAVAALHAAARSLADRERDLVAAAQSQVLGRAVELAELIVAGELADAETSALSAVRRVLAVVDAAAVRELRLHPGDIGTLDRLDARPAGFALAPDETLEPGDAVAALEHGLVDARIGSALERARRAVAEGGA
jgi:flagellar assembly protein FliH